MSDIIIKNIKGDFWKLLEQLYVHKICEPLSGALDSELRVLCLQENPNFSDLMAGVEACKINPTTQRLVLLDSDIPQSISFTGVWVFVMLLNHLQQSGVKFEILLSKEGFDACVWPTWYRPLAAVSKACNIKETFWFEIFKKAYIANLKMCVYVLGVEGGVLYTHTPIKECTLGTLYETLVYLRAEVMNDVTVYAPYNKDTLDALLRSVATLNFLCVQSIVAVLPENSAAAFAAVFPTVTTDSAEIDGFLRQQSAVPSRILRGGIANFDSVITGRLELIEEQEDREADKDDLLSVPPSYVQFSLTEGLVHRLDMRPQPGQGAGLDLS